MRRDGALEAANYNEADVSDKPAAIQALQPLGNQTGWPMVGHWREMLGVDWAVGG